MIAKYIEPYRLFGNKYVVRLNNGTREQIEKSTKVFETYEDAKRYDESINDHEIFLELHTSTDTAENFIEQAEKDLQQATDDLNSFVEKTKSGVQEEIKQMKDPFKSVDILNEHDKCEIESIRKQKEAETDDILDEDGIVYFDNQPFFRESDLIKYEKKKEKDEKDKEKDDTMIYETMDNILKKYNFSSEKLEKDENSAVNHPKHYQNDGGLETIDEMILLFGLEETMIFCKLNAWKYRARASKKGSEKEDLEKANWYILKYEELEKRKL